MCEKCGHISCVCAIRKKHDAKCKFRTAATCAVGVECEHGYDVCPICDPCTCSARMMTVSNPAANCEPSMVPQYVTVKF